MGPQISPYDIIWEEFCICNTRYTSTKTQARLKKTYLLFILSLSPMIVPFRHPRDLPLCVVLCVCLTYVMCAVWYLCHTGKRFPLVVRGQESISQSIAHMRPMMWFGCW